MMTRNYFRHIKLVIFILLGITFISNAQNKEYLKCAVIDFIFQNNINDSVIYAALISHNEVRILEERMLDGRRRFFIDLFTDTLACLRIVTKIKILNYRGIYNAIDPIIRKIEIGIFEGLDTCVKAIVYGCTMDSWTIGPTYEEILEQNKPCNILFIRNQFAWYSRIPHQRGSHYGDYDNKFREKGKKIKKKSK